MELFLLVAHQAVSWLAFAATAWAAGRCVARCWPVERPLPASLMLAFGLALWAQILFLLGLLDLLRAPIVAGLALASHAAAFREWRSDFASWRRYRLEKHERLAAASAAVLVLPLAILTLYPPLGFDQTLYHLPFTRAFAGNGGLVYLPELRFPVFPQLAELLAVPLWWLGGVSATQLVGLTALIAGVGLLYRWTAESFGRAAGAVAAGILFGSPCVVYLAVCGYVEPVLALFAVAAAYCALRARAEGTSAAALAWAAAAGGLAGSAAGVKYLGLFFLPMAALPLLRREKRATLRLLAPYAAAVALAALPSYLRIMAQGGGSPLFPFYSTVFGSSPWDAHEMLGAQGLDRLAGAATRLWDITFRRAEVGGLPPFSPAFGLALPLVLAAAIYRPGLRWALAVGLLYLAVTPSNAHYFLGIAPLFCWAIGGALAWATQQAPRVHRSLTSLTSSLTLVAWLLAGMGAAYGLFHLHRLGPVPTTDSARERLLAEQIPHYGAVAFVNHSAPGAIVYGVQAERMVAYAQGPFLGDHNGPASFARVAARAARLGSLARALDEHGVEILLVNQEARDWLAWARADRRLREIYRDAYAVVYRVEPAPAVEGISRSPNPEPTARS
jgi:hypothetical protein